MNKICYNKAAMVDFFIFIKEQQQVELILDDDKRIYGTIMSVIGNNVTIVTQYKQILKKNQAIEVNTYSENGVYSGISRVLDYKIEYKKRTIVISYPKEIKHSQRREYLRAELKANYELTIDSDEGISVITGETRNICGKGVSFFYSKPLSKFSKYNIKIKVENKEIVSSCQLVYTKVMPFNSKPMFVNAFVLTGITIDDIKFLVDKCMEYHLNLK